MGKRKRKFIDKKKAVTFRLVSRSQRDPLLVDETAPKHVLVPAQGESVQPKSANESVKLDKESLKKELHQYGIFFEDEYNYLQHLREPGKNFTHWEEVEQKKGKVNEKDKPKIQLPSSVFASEFEEDEGLLNKAIPRPGPRPDWDPDIVEALDDDFDFDNPENQLEDDFITKAIGSGSGSDWEDDYDDEDQEDGESNVDSQNMGFSDEELDALGPLPHEDFDREETKSRFTEYSMSSSVIRRNDQLTLLDDRFEKFFEKYDEPEVGALECEEIEGHVEINDQLLLQYAEEFKADEKAQKYEKNWDVCRLVKLQEETLDGEEELVEYEVEEENKKVWDCESILSNYSNIYNHPKLIADPPKKRNSKIQIHPKTGIPLNTLDGDRSNKLTSKTLAKLETEELQKNSNAKSLCAESVLSTLSVLSIRPKDETVEEKRERKKLLKEYRNERRIEKKANKLAFKEEHLKQHKIKINANVSGAKLI